MKTGRPFVRLKLAITIDGRVAARDGTSKWITSDESRRDVHHWRGMSGAIVTGIGTVLSDNPRLDARIDGDVVQPLRVILDSKLRLKASASLFDIDSPILVCTALQGETDLSQFDARVDVTNLRKNDCIVDLESLLIELGKRECNDILIEAGPTLAGRFVFEGLVDEYLLYQAPDILGNKGISMFSLEEISTLSEKVSLDLTDIATLGRDLRLTLKPHKEELN